MSLHDSYEKQQWHQAERDLSDSRLRHSKKEIKHARLRKLVRGLLDNGWLDELLIDEQLELMKLSNWKEKK